MIVKTDALVLKEQKIGENDRLITLLTRDMGVIRAFAKIAGKGKSGLQSATQLLSYSEFTVSVGKTNNRIREAEALEVYFGLWQDVEKVSLAQYFIQLISESSLESDEGGELLRIMLNTLYFLNKSLKNTEQLKAIVELRVICMCGYMPDFSGCARCGKQGADGERYIFDYLNGRIFCEDCRPSLSGPHAVINMSVLSALRHIVNSDISHLFSFNMSEENFKTLSDVTEGYAITQLGRGFTALDFYKSVKLN